MILGQPSASRPSEQMFLGGIFKRTSIIEVQKSFSDEANAVQFFEVRANMRKNAKISYRIEYALGFMM